MFLARFAGLSLGGTEKVVTFVNFLEGMNRGTRYTFVDFWFYLDACPKFVSIVFNLHDH